jgi:hypothetical protein
MKAHFTIYENNGSRSYDVVDVSAAHIRQSLSALNICFKRGQIKGAYVLVEGRSGDREYTIDADGVTLM